MGKVLLLVIFTLFICTINVPAQDTLSVKGRHYQFIESKADTVTKNGSTYIVKYVVEPEQAEDMRREGKIYVVVIVLATIFAGIFAYLIYLDRKIGKLEKEQAV
jgi:CcmD family protein